LAIEIRTKFEWRICEREEEGVLLVPKAGENALSTAQTPAMAGGPEIEPVLICAIYAYPLIFVIGDLRACKTTSLGNKVHLIRLAAVDLDGHASRARKAISEQNALRCAG